MRFTVVVINSMEASKESRIIFSFIIPNILFSNSKWNSFEFVFLKHFEICIIKITLMKESSLHILLAENSNQSIQLLSRSKFNNSTNILTVIVFFYILHQIRFNFSEVTNYSVYSSNRRNISLAKELNLLDTWSIWSTSKLMWTTVTQQPYTDDDIP